MVSVGKLRMRHGRTLLIFGLVVIQILQTVHFILHPTPCLDKDTQVKALDRSSTRNANIYILEETKTTQRPSLMSRLYGFIRGGKDTTWRSRSESSSGPVVYVVTATYRRVAQMADLTRLAQTLTNLDFVYWVVVEDGETTSPSVAALLERTGIPHHYSAAPTPQDQKNSASLGRGVFNRRAALNWLRQEGRKGVLYFADDDNTYDVRLFRQMRATQKVSVFPVGLILQYGISSPIVQDRRVVGFHDAFQAGRLFAMDMAGFAVNLELVHKHPSVTLPAQVSYLEDGFLRQLEVRLEDLEPLAEDCTEVLVWHTRTEPAFTPSRQNLPVNYRDTNLDALYSSLLD